MKTRITRQLREEVGPCLNNVLLIHEAKRLPLTQTERLLGGQRGMMLSYHGALRQTVLANSFTGKRGRACDTPNVSAARLHTAPAYLAHMQSASWETPGWRKHRLESRLLGEIPTSSDMQTIPL